MKPDVFTQNNQDPMAVSEDITIDYPKRINPTWEALVRLKGAMHTDDPKYRYEVD